MQDTATPKRRSVNTTSPFAAASVVLLVFACVPPLPTVHTPPVQRCPVVVHVVDVHQACGALESYCRARQQPKRPPRLTRVPMCIADWACDVGYECNTSSFECEPALE